MKQINFTRSLVSAFALIAVVGAANAQLRDLNSGLEGRGTLKYNSRSSNSEVRRVNVLLRNNGSVEIRLSGGVDETFYGKWINTNPRSVKIEIDRIGRDRAEGSGVVEHDGRGNFTKINFNGNAGRSRFDFDFRPIDRGHDRDRDRDRDDRRQPTDNDFFRNAHDAIQSKFDRGTRIEWRSESLGGLTFGRRVIRGEFTISRGRDQGRYKYTVGLGAGTALVQDATYKLIR